MSVYLANAEQTTDQRPPTGVGVRLGASGQGFRVSESGEIGQIRHSFHRKTASGGDIQPRRIPKAGREEEADRIHGTEVEIRDGESLPKMVDL